jgi:hypothetical protein
LGGTFYKFAFFFDIFTLKNISFIPRKSIFHVFFVEFAFSRGTFDKSSFFNPNLFYYNRLFVFFYFINEKKLLIKYFFIINVPINYPPLSKKSLNLSKSCPIGLKKFRKIPKNPEKIRFFTFFSYALSRLFVKSRQTSYRKKSRKKTSKKKSKKK